MFDLESALRVIGALPSEPHQYPHRIERSLEKKLIIAKRLVFVIWLIHVLGTQYLFVGDTIVYNSSSCAAVMIGQ